METGFRNAVKEKHASSLGRNALSGSNHCTNRAQGLGGGGGGVLPSNEKAVSSPPLVVL